jgi:two-component system, OmpR family, response regulator VanR
MYLHNKTILLVEDDIIALRNMKSALGIFFERVLTATDGNEALELFDSEAPNIVITDVKLPRRNGISLAECIRKENYRIPIIMISNYSERDLLLKALNLSIDAYLTKPVSLNALSTAITKAFQRQEHTEPVVHLGKDLIYFTQRREVYRQGQPVMLGKKETELLALLIENRNRTITLEEISYRLWHLDYRGESALKNSILRLRKKLYKDLIISVRGLGYSINIHCLSAQHDHVL